MSVTIDYMAIWSALRHLVVYDPQAHLYMGSLEFAILFVVFLGVYTCLKRLNRTAMMVWTVLFSLFFAYKANGPILSLLLLSTAVLNHWLTQGMRVTSSTWGKRVWLTLTILLDVGILGYFKYMGFILDEVLNRCFDTNFAPLTILLPVGVSFYTFQAISYAVDVYRGRFTREVSLLEYCCYLCYFPLLLAGPITRAEHLIPALQRNHQATATMVWRGLWLVLLGVVKKGILSDYLAQYNNWVFAAPDTFSGWENMMALLGYGAQLYLDFSGYSDMSIGVASIMGFHLPDNFRSPFHARNISDFWRRWHISLSTWFRDYIYIPLGGNRHGYAVMYIATIITMIVAGLWHGAGWMFLIWGLMHGMGLVVHKCFSRQMHCTIPDTWWGKPISWTITFVFVTMSWMFFRCADIDTAMDMCRSIFLQMDIAYALPFWQARTLWCVVLGVVMLTYFLSDRVYNRLEARFVKSPWVVKLLVVMAVIQMAIEFAQQNVQPFIYFQF